MKMSHLSGEQITHSLLCTEGFFHALRLHTIVQSRSGRKLGIFCSVKSRIYCKHLDTIGSFQENISRSVVNHIYGNCQIAWN